jgi:coenzyme F420-reducing hydrogenase beta subunit
LVCGHCGICGISALFPLSALYAVMQFAASVESQRRFLCRLCMQFAASVESQRREMVRVRIRERLERKHGLTVRAHNLPRFLNDIGLPVRVYEL